MYILETSQLTPQNLTLPHAQIERLGRPPLLQIYSPTLPPLRHLQRQLKGKIRKLIVRPSTPFQLRIAQRLLITSDHRVVAKKDRAIPRLKIRAGPAFGSGEHATTHLCLRYLTHFLASSPKPKPTVLDLGCGSGILALAAAKWNANAIGWDLDPTAIQEAQRNARINRLNNKARFLIIDALRAPLPNADLIVANLYDSLLLHLLPRLERHRKSHTSLIFSGILHGQENSIIRAARRFRWKLQRRGRLGRWHCLQFRA